MPVIGHERVTVKSQIDPIERFEQGILKGRVVNVFVENGFPAVGPVEHVIDATGFVGSFRSSHGTRLDSTDGRKSPKHIASILPSQP